MKVFSLLMKFVSIAAASNNGAFVSIAIGELQGISRNSANILPFFGIPFTALPVGGLLWKTPLPQPVSKWNETFNATQYGPSCYSAAVEYPPPTTASEGCLSLNIWTPAPDSNEKLAVMIWIYSGGFQFGDFAVPTLEPSPFQTCAHYQPKISINQAHGMYPLIRD